MTKYLHTGADLRDWLREHQVFKFSAERDPRSMSGKSLAGGSNGSATVTSAAMRELDREIVWMHQAADLGVSFPAGALFVLREQLDLPVH